MSPTVHHILGPFDHIVQPIFIMYPFHTRFFYFLFSFHLECGHPPLCAFLASFISLVGTIWFGKSVVELLREELGTTTKSSPIVHSD